MKKCIFLVLFLSLSSPAIEISPLKLIKSFTTKIPEPSSLSFSSDQQYLWSVSDQNGLAYSLNLDGQITSQFQTGGSDLEGIVAHDDLNGSCVVSERIRELRCFDKNWKSIKSKKIPFTGVSNSGFEGVAYNPLNRHFYIVNEKTPTAIVELNNEFDILRTMTFTEARDLSDIFFDNIEQRFWIVSHESKMIFQADLNFNILTRYSIPEVLQAEGIVVDSMKRKIYVISDKDSKLFIYEY